MQALTPDDDPGAAREGLLQPESASERRTLAVALARQARASLCILSPDLEPAVYDAREFVAAVTALITGSRRAEVRVIVRDPAAVARRGHRLVTLAHRLDSRVHLRRPDEERCEAAGAFLIADATGYLQRMTTERRAATANLHDPARVHELQRTFDALWEYSVPTGELQRLYL